MKQHEILLLFMRADYFVCNDGFAGLTLRKRLPSILDRLFEDWPQLGVKEKRSLERLREELVQDEKLLNVCDASTVTLGRSWSSHPFLHVEIVFYKRILESFGFFGGANAGIDPFLKQKQVSKDHAMTAMRTRLNGPRLSLEETFLASFWGNKTDLSLHSLSEVRQKKRMYNFLDFGKRKKKRRLLRAAVRRPPFWSMIYLWR